MFPMDHSAREQENVFHEEREEKKGKEKREEKKKEARWASLLRNVCLVFRWEPRTSRGMQTRSTFLGITKRKTRAWWWPVKEAITYESFIRLDRR